MHEIVDIKADIKAIGQAVGELVGVVSAPASQLKGCVFELKNVILKYVVSKSLVTNNVTRVYFLTLQTQKTLYKCIRRLSGTPHD